MLHQNFTLPRGRGLLLWAWRLKQQRESIGVMKIRFVGRMTKRPVRQPIAGLDNRREPDSQSSSRVNGRQTFEPHQGVELEPTASGTHRDVRAHNFVRNRTSVAIAAEGVDGPLSRGREV